MAAGATGRRNARSRRRFAKFATAFIHDLARFDLPVDAVDERYSSVEAEALLKSRRKQGLRGRISKADIDAAAATLIAERWLKMEHQ